MKSSVIGILAVVSVTAQAQGSFDFSQIPGLTASPQVQIDLNPATLGFVAEATRATDPEAAELLEGIRNVRVSVYEKLPDAQPVLDFVDTASSALEAEGWQRSVFVDSGADKVRMYMMTEDTQIMGLTVMVTGGGGEAVFVNVDGTIDPAQFGKVAATLGMGGMLGAFNELGAAAAAGAGPGPAPAPAPEAPAPPDGPAASDGPAPADTDPANEHGGTDGTGSE